MRVVVIAGPNGAGKSTFAYAARLRRWLYRDVADEWRVYDSSGWPPVLMARSPGWRGVRESRARRYISSEITTTRTGTMATENPPRFPEGEPSHESILAALARARKRAMARAAAVRRGEPVEAAERSDGGDRTRTPPRIPG